MVGSTVMIPQEIVAATMQEQMRAAARERLERDARELDRTAQSGHGRQPRGRVTQLLQRLHMARA
jgi:hypothetical protein